ncbi:MAG: DUF1464 domain-containing protein [Dehalococcoidia bacterium]|nr:MAG: DUF1464 domain-containing protein [Dehalococcoidia bacterium]
MRVVGIDPGTGSFDFFGMDNEQVILDCSVPVPEVAQNPNVLVDTVRSAFPLDMIVGPSGYGLPLTPIKDVTERERTLMVPDDKSIPLYDGIRMVVWLMKDEGFPIYFTPGVIHLPTVPAYRKANKMDMGTADKVCCVALAVKDQAELYGIDYNETSFILAEIGYAFNAVIGVEGGKIVDGFGGTSGGPGFITLGSMDSELAVRLGRFPGIVLFSGGARDMTGKDDLTPEELARERHKYIESWNMLLESIVKGVAAMMVAVERPRDILLSGRLSGIPEIAETLAAKLSQFGRVRRVRRQASIAKEAAEGAYIIGEGLLGGKYKGIVDCLELRRARGTMFDHIRLKGVELPKP